MICRKDVLKMKNKIGIGILLLYSAFCLSSCGTTEQVIQQEDSAIEKNIVNDKDSEDSEKIDENNPNQSKDIDYKWYEKRLYRDITNTTHWIDFRDTESGITVDVPGFSFVVGQPEIIESNEYGTALRYQYKEEYGRFDFIIDYMMERDQIIVLYTNYTVQSSNAVDYSGVYAYSGTLSSNMENTETSKDDVVSMIDGQRFECFETASGEDIILTVHLYYSDDNDTPSAYKGEMNNGVEFWFELYDTNTDEETYKINCLDDSVTFLTYYPSRGEIELTAEEGTEYGNMYVYSGTYIELPDTVEE